MIQLLHTAGAERAVGRGSAHDVTARHERYAPAWKAGSQARDVLRHGDVDGDGVREDIGVPLVGHGHVDDPAAQQPRECTLAPGEFVHGEIDLIAERTNFLHDTLVSGGKRVKRAGKECGRQRRGKAQPALHDLRLHKEAVQVIQHGSPIEERQLAWCGLGQKAQELFAHAGKAVRPQGERQTLAADDIVAQNGHGAAVHGLVIVRHTRQQQAEAVLRQHAVFRQGGDQTAERPERGRSGAGAAAAQQAVEEVDAFADLLFRHGAQQPPEITGDKACDLLLAVFQLAHEVDDDLIALVDAQARADGQKRAPGVLAHGKVLADGQQIGKMRRRVECVARVLQRIGLQQVDLGVFHDPRHGSLQIAEVEQRGLGFRERRGRFTAQAAAQGTHGGKIIRKRHSGLLQQVLRRGGTEAPQAAQGRNAAALVRTAQQGAQPVRRRGERGDGMRRGVVEGVEQHEAVLVRGIRQAREQRLRQPRRVLRLGQKRFGNGLQRVGDALGVLRGDFVVGVQALRHGLLPQAERFLQHGEHRGRGCVLRRGGGQLLAVFRPAVGQNAAHELPGQTANVALGIQQQLIEEGEQLALVSAGHIGVVFLKQLEVGADAQRVLLAAGLLEQLVKRCVRADGVHQADGVVERQRAQGVQRLLLREQGGVARFALRRGAGLRGRAAAVQIGLKIAQLRIDRAVTALLFRRNVRQL